MLSCFRRELTSLYSNLPEQRRPPSTIRSIRELDTRLPDGEDGIPLRSLVLKQYRSVTGRSGRTGGQTDLP